MVHLRKKFGRRKFGGKYFTLPTENSWALRGSAEKQAKKLRREGFKVRVVKRPNMKRYDVYQR